MCFRVLGGLLIVALGCHSPAPPASDAPGAYTLDDAEQRNREAPDTFPIPPAGARRNLEPGQVVKLLFCIPAGDEEQVERMWVVVRGRDGDAYVGELDNQPVTTDRLRPGIRVRFEPRHVIAIHRKRAW